jgi:hypothetical protein
MRAVRAVCFTVKTDATSVRTNDAKINPGERFHPAAAMGRFSPAAVFGQ